MSGAPRTDGDQFGVASIEADQAERRADHLEAGDDCPKCGGELHKVKHRYQDSGGHPDCDWLACLDCNYATDPE